MSEPTLDNLRTHLLWQLDPHLPRGGAKRIASAILVLLDPNGLLDADALLEVAFEQLDEALAGDMMAKHTALLAGLCFMSGEERDAAVEAFERFLGEDLGHDVRGEVGEAASRLDGVLQHLGHLRRQMLEDAQADPSLLASVAQLDGDADEIRVGAQDAIRRGVGVRSASRIVAFLNKPAPAFAPGPSLVFDIIERAMLEWQSGRFHRAKSLLDRVLGRDVLHDERDGIVRLLGVMGSRVLTPLAWSREARRELLLVTVARITSMPTAEVRHVLSLVHRCDPVGAGARDPAESARLQAKWNGLPDYVVDLADRALEELGEEVDYPTLSARYGRTVDELKGARAVLRRYVKRPIERLVLGVDEASSDLIFVREGPEFMIHTGMCGKIPAVPADELMRVGRVILDASVDFMRYGVIQLTPIGVDEIARRADLTIDQVKRVTEGVRVETPWGTMAITHFIRS